MSTATSLSRTDARVRNITQLIGRTPIIELTKVTDDLPESVTVYGKAEHTNPGGSVKDRPALAMIREGLDTGVLRPDGGKTLIDATSGNTGIAYAMIGAALDIPVALAMPANATEERRKTLRAYGAEVMLTDPMEGTDGAQRFVKERVEQSPDRYYYPDQYNNAANWQSHYDGTGREILEQTDGEVTHFVAGLGTTGTFVGTSRRLRTYDPGITCIGVQPDSPFHGLEGMKHLDTAIVPGIYEPGTADRMVFVETEEAYEMTRRLARDEGLFVGVSAGAAVVATLRIARELGDAVLVTILPDGGSRYMSEDFWTS